jgi:hypothetical protein
MMSSRECSPLLYDGEDEDENETEETTTARSSLLPPNLPKKVHRVDSCQELRDNLTAFLSSKKTTPAPVYGTSKTSKTPFSQS